MDIKTVGIVGAGQMGNGIAHVFALAGYDVLLTDISQDALDRAVALIDRNLDRQVSRDKIDEADEVRRDGADPHDAEADRPGQTDLIIEAATERETVKQAIFEDLLPASEARHDPDLEHLLDLDHAAGVSRTDRPEKFMGFHFMNPVPVMQLVELIRGIATDEPTYQRLRGRGGEARQDGGQRRRISRPSSSTAS